MTRYVLLLRGVNVGGRTRVTMADLRAVLERCGATDVRTHLNSGNAVFTGADEDGVSAGDHGDRFAGRVESALAAHYARPVRCLVRSRDELGSVIDRNPLLDVATDPSHLLVTFLSGVPDPAVFRGIDPAALLPERFAVGERELYLWCPGGVADAQVTKVLSDKRLGVWTTARNWNTVRRLLELADS